MSHVLELLKTLKTKKKGHEESFEITTKCVRKL
jgi:hypothetical protein